MTPKVSVIIPVYNRENYLAECIKSIAGQTVDKCLLEVLVVDDGSVDNSCEIIEKYSEKFPFIRLIKKEHSGVSASRNRGIMEAKGKYIAFLDSDDTLSPETLKEVTDFFDTVYEETDLVTYKIVHYKFGKKTKEHFRYEVLKESGVYDLNRWPYINQTTMNVIIKNDKSFLLDTSLELMEDQMFNWSIIESKMTIGYCDKGAYIYNRNSNSTVVTKHNSIDFFEPAMTAWEKATERYDHIPRGLQSLIITEMNYGIKDDYLFPHHYEGERQKNADKRIVSLLNRIDTDIIWNHPVIDEFHKHYWINRKTDVKKEILILNDKASVLIDGQIVLSESKLKIVVKKAEIEEGIFELFGVLESGLFNYIPETRPLIIADINGNRTELEAFDSAESCYRSKTRTNNFYGFRFQYPVEKDFSLKFIVKIGDYSFKTMLDSLIYKTKKTNTVLLIREGKIIEINDELITLRNASFIESVKVRHLNSEGKSAGAKAYRACSAAIRMRNKRIWIYNDSAAIQTDNAFLQFQHDWIRKDGIERYYVFDGDISGFKDRFSSDQQKNLVEFGSVKHKILYLSAEFVLTSFSDQEPKRPFSNGAMRDYSDIRGPEIIYLQHGVCLPDIRYLQSAETNKVDKIVVSAKFERENYISIYNYKPEDLLPFGMARYDIIDRDAKPQNRILFAPSWRAYFVSNDSARREINSYMFENSNYYKNFMLFLSSPELSKLLEKYDFTLDLRLHQNMRKGLDNISFSSDRIRMADLNEHIENYKVFITDFSTFAFDFVYLKRAIMYFIPDITEIRSGMHMFRDFGLPFEEWYGEVTFNPEDALKALEKLLEQGAIPEEEYKQRMDDCFLPFEKPREDLYQYLYKF